jgi:hypothetical protein
MAFPPDTTYATKTELKERISVEAASTASDGLLQQLCNDAAYMVDHLTRGALDGYEAFSESASETRYFDDDGSGVVWLNDLLTISSITRGTATIAATYYKQMPLNRGNGPTTHIALRSDALINFTPATNSLWYGYPYEGVGLGQIGVTGTWGYCTQANRPAVVKEATLQIANLMYKQSGLSMSDVLNILQRDPTAFLSKPIADRLQVLRPVGGSLFA